MTFHRSLAVSLVLAIAVATAPQALAGDDEQKDKDWPLGRDSGQRRDQYDARKALLEGQILPLTRILAIVEKRVKGPVTEVELENDDNRFIYMVQVLSTDGHKVDLELDARTGEILKSRKR